MAKISKITRYWAEWCKPCQAFAHTFEEASNDEKYKDIEFKSLNIESEGFDDSVKFAIRSIPTTIIFDEDEKVLRKVVGNVSLTVLKEIIDEVIQS